MSALRGLLALMLLTQLVLSGCHHGGHLGHISPHAATTSASPHYSSSSSVEFADFHPVHVLVSQPAPAAPAPWPAASLASRWQAYDNRRERVNEHDMFLQALVVLPFAALACQPPPSREVVLVSYRDSDIAGVGPPERSGAGAPASPFDSPRSANDWYGGDFGTSGPGLNDGGAGHLASLGHGPGQACDDEHGFGFGDRLLESPLRLKGPPFEPALTP